ncbi:hypothetical protein DFR24_1277 [Panacagrimonas perspica]|uniref:Uncharacterized protein n=1 Tax=Panacagrimonas perspica TaxID=381431 RepID=A0A4R7PCR5_9GAMM|nr:hypothetical protein [Panacagrimonas perspica]TDU31893.1 hypothetical protein DFR24_1277 [Panacagrimonas perspica]THD04216.1 hypothetical protein B1810_06150 [Panacagrimonas perspica]
MEFDPHRRVLRPYGAYAFSTFPFANVQSSSCLPEDQYETLSATFPEIACFPQNGSAADRAVLRIPSSRVLAEPGFSEAWKWFVEQHTAQAFWLQILETFGPQLHAGFQQIERRMGRPMKRWRVARLGSGEPGDVYLGCDLVVNTGATGLASSQDKPHVDPATRLWTGLLTLRDAADAAAGGDLRLYRGLEGLRFDAHRAPRNGVIHEVTARYAANAFIGFVNGPQAIHSVSMRPSTPHVRRYVDLVVEMDRPAFELPQMHPLRRSWFRLVHRQAGR